MPQSADWIDTSTAPLVPCFTIKQLVSSLYRASSWTCRSDLVGCWVASAICLPDAFFAVLWTRHQVCSCFVTCAFFTNYWFTFSCCARLVRGFLACLCVTIGFCVVLTLCTWIVIGTVIFVVVLSPQLLGLCQLQELRIRWVYIMLQYSSRVVLQAF
jgi:hypothetical protein